MITMSPAFRARARDAGVRVPLRLQVRWSVAAAIAAVLAIVAPPAAPTIAAHDLGVTHAILTFTPGRYQLDVVVDPESILAKLELYADRTPTANVPAAEVPGRIVALGDVALARTRIAFDGVPSTATFSYLPTAPKGPAPPSAATALVPGAPSLLPPATLRFTGDVPAGARTCTITYGLVLGSYALTLVAPDGKTSAPVWVAGAQESPVLDLRAGFVTPPWWVTAGEYAGLGFTHILPKGLDHILFVIGLFLLGTKWRPLLLQVTLFTIAHSMTLGLSMLGIVSLPSSIVEPLIALSIAYVAIENVMTSELHAWRPVVVFGFGLLHGMGFAGVLQEIGMPRSEFLTALIAFNVGVELGQLAVISGAFVLTGIWMRGKPWYRRRFVVPASLAIAATGLYWTVERVLG